MSICTLGGGGRVWNSKMVTFRHITAKHNHFVRVKSPTFLSFTNLIQVFSRGRCVLGLFSFANMKKFSLFSCLFFFSRLAEAESEGGSKYDPHSL